MPAKATSCGSADAVEQLPFNGAPKSLTPPPPPPPPPTPLPHALQVSSLLKEHAARISRLRMVVAMHPHYDAAKHDDLFLLRFAMSHASDAAAGAAVCTALTVRHKYSLDDVAKEVTSSGTRNWSQRRHRGWVHLMPVEFIQVDAYAPGVLYADLRECDMYAAAAVPHAQFSEAQRYMMEFVFQRMDWATRRSGVITKYVRIINMRGARLSAVNPRFVKRDADDNKELQSLYPQLLGAVLVCNLPPAIDTFYRRVIAPMLPRKVTEKTKVLQPLSRAEDRAVLEGWCPLAVLPPDLGGSTASSKLDTSEPRKEVALAARAAHDEALAAGLSAQERFAAFFIAGDAADAAITRQPSEQQTVVDPFWWSRDRSEYGAAAHRACGRLL